MTRVANGDWSVLIGLKVDGLVGSFEEDLRGADHNESERVRSFLEVARTERLAE